MIKSLRSFYLLILLFIFWHSSNGQLTANFTSSIQSGCVPLTVVFGNTSSPGASSFNWNFGNGNSSSIQNPAATYSLPGTYTVTLTVSNGTTTDQEIKINYITVYSNPVASFNANPDTACVGSPISFHSTSVPGTGGSINNWRWNFGDGNIDNVSGTNATHSYTFPQAFSANLIISDVHGCNSTISKNVVAVNGAIANFTTNPVSGCNAPLVVSFTNTTVGAASGYQWNFGDLPSGANNSSVLTNPFHTFNSTGTFTITLTAYSGACTAVHTYALQIQYTTPAFTTSAAICDGDTAFFTNNTVPANATSLWDFGDGTTDNTTNPFHHFPAPGFYTVRLTSTANGCTSFTTQSVHVRNRPIALINATPVYNCLAPQLVTFSVPTPNISNWLWGFDDPASGANNVSVLSTPAHSYSQYLQYAPWVIVTDIYGCKDTAVFNYVSVQSLIESIEIDSINSPYTVNPVDSGCIPLTHLFRARNNNLPPFPVAQCTWNFGDGTGNFTRTTDTISHTFTVTGYYLVTLTMVTPTGCTITVTKTIGAGTRPNGGFTSNPTTVCFGDTVHFSSIATDSITSWLWQFGDGKSTIETSPLTSHIYDVDTAVLNPFTVTMISYNHGCPDTTTQSQLITVNTPVPDFNYTHDCSDHHAFYFSNDSRGSTNVDWDFGDTTAILTQDFTIHTFLYTGIYNVKMTAHDTISGCSFPISKQVYITDPVARFNFSPATGCGPLTVTFSDSSQDGISNFYSWNFDDQHDTAGVSVIDHIYNRPGIYYPSLNISDYWGCHDSISKMVHVFGTTAGFSSNVTRGCTPLNVLFTDTSLTEGSPIVSRHWDFGNGAVTDSNATISHDYPRPGEYTVTLSVVDSSGCTSSVTRSTYIITYIPEPTVVINDTFACPGQPITFDIFTGWNVYYPFLYEINYGDFTTDTAISIITTHQFTHNYSSNNAYTISIHITDVGGCDSTITSHLTILKPTANYSVSLLDTCVSHPPFNTNITTTLATFSDLSTGMPGNSGNSWNWNFGTATGTQSVLQNPMGQYYSPGYYTPQLIVTNSAGCSDTARLDSIVNVPGPSGDFTFSPSNGCAPLTVNFSGSTSSPGLFFTWDFGDGNVSSEVPDSNVVHVYNHDGIYNPYFYIGYQLPGGSFCKSVGPNLTGPIAVKTFLTVSINPSVVYVPEDYDTTVFAVVFDTTTSGGPPFTYFWSPLSNINATDSFAVVSLNNNISSAYYYCSVTNAQGCRAMDSVLVLIYPCDTRSTIPNIFTPNDDGVNDLFHINYLCATQNFKFKIFNRWGELIYETNDPDFHWDGKNQKGTDASEGTYYFVMHALRRDTKGFIELIRDK